MRGRRARAAAARRGETRARARGPAARPRRASRTRSTCSGRRDRRDLRGGAPARSLADPQRRRGRSSCSCPPCRVDRRRRRRRDRRGAADARRADKPVLAVDPQRRRARRRRCASRQPRRRRSPIPESAARALGRAAERAEWLRRAARHRARRSTGIDRAGAPQRSSPRRSTRDDDGVARPGRDARRCSRRTASRSSASASPTTADEAVAAADELGYPAVVKTAAPGAHKTETGGVALDLARRRRRSRPPRTRIGLPVIVQPMIAGGVELLAGRRPGPVFGPLVAFGPGGVFAELIGDARFRLAPLTDVDADELVARGQGRQARRRASAARRPPTPTRSPTSCTGSPGSRDDLPEVAELDLNPVIGLPDRAVVVDARIRVHAARCAPTQELVAPSRHHLSPSRSQQLRDRGLPVIALGSIVAGAALWLIGKEQLGRHRLGRRCRRRARAARGLDGAIAARAGTSASTRSRSSRSSGRSRSASSSPPRSSP